MYFVRSWLAIGTHEDAAQADLLAAHNIGAVLLLTQPTHQPVVPALHLPLTDDAFIPAYRIRQGTQFIHDQRNCGRRILIVCETGIRLSVAFAMAAIKEKHGNALPLIDVFKSIARQQPAANLPPVLWDSLFACFDDEPSYDVLWYQIQMLTRRPLYEL